MFSLDCIWRYGLYIRCDILSPEAITKVEGSSSPSRGPKITTKERNKLFAIWEGFLGMHSDGQVSSFFVRDVYL